MDPIRLRTMLELSNLKLSVAYYGDNVIGEGIKTSLHDGLRIDIQLEEMNYLNSFSIWFSDQHRLHAIRYRKLYLMKTNKSNYFIVELLKLARIAYVQLLWKFLLM